MGNSYISHALPCQPLRGGWWLLDIETSGLSPEESEIIALRLAFMEDLQARDEFTIFVRPYQLLPEAIKRFVGITDGDLRKAIPRSSAVHKLKHLARQGPLAFWDRNFTLPFLRSMFENCGDRFELPHLRLDGLGGALLGEPLGKSPERTLKALGIPCSSPLQNRYLAQLHTLTALLFERLEQRGIHTTEGFANGQR